MDDDADDSVQAKDQDSGVGSDVDRDKLPESDFAGPNRSYPIVTAGDVADAASLIGKAADPAAVKARIISIAKRKGFALPKAWQASEDSLVFYSDDQPRDDNGRWGDGGGGGVSKADAMSRGSRLAESHAAETNKDAQKGSTSVLKSIVSSHPDKASRDAGNRAIDRISKEQDKTVKTAMTTHLGRILGEAIHASSRKAAEQKTCADCGDDLAADESGPLCEDCQADADDEKKAAEPTLSGVHVDTPIGVYPKSKSPAGDPGTDDDATTPPASVKRPLNRAFRKMRELLKGKVADEDIMDAMRKARAHAAGSASAEKRKASHEDVRQWFIELPESFSFDEAPDWIPYLPLPGTYDHPRWGKIHLSEERNRRFVTNFNSGIYQTPLPLDAEHETKVSGAMAWIKHLRMNSNGSVDANVSWTDRGRKMLAENRYKFISPEWYDEWVAPDTGKTYKDIVIGGAMTTRPFFKESVLRAIAAREFDADEINTLLLESVRIGSSRAASDTTALGTDAKSETVTESEGVKMFEEKTTPTGAATAATDDVAKKAAEDAKTASERITAAETEAKTLREENTRMAAEQKSMAERLQAIENASQSKRFTDEVMGRSEENGTRWFGEVDKHVGMLTKLAKTFGEDGEEVKQYVELNREHAKRIEASEAFSVHGRGGAGATGGAWEQIQAKAKTMVEAAPTMSLAEAITEVSIANPDLARRYAEEKGGK